MSYARTRNMIDFSTQFAFVKQKFHVLLILTEIGYIAEALAEDIFCVGHDEKGVFVNVLNHLSDLAYLRALYNAQKHLLILL